MVRQSRISPEYHNHSFIIFPIILTLLVLIGIGDIVRFILRAPVVMLRGILLLKTPWSIIPLPHITLPKVTFHTIDPTKQIRAFVAGSVLTIVFIFIPYVCYLWLQGLPNPYLLTHKDLAVTTKIFDRNGILLYEIYADQNRTPLALNQIPNYVKEATIAIEDKNFYHHTGFSPKGILRAFLETKFNGKLQGGSTITQQLIKSSLLTPEISIKRKIKELILAFWAERLYTKNQILTMYLNQVSYGGTAWGIEAASQTYFGKSAKMLTLAESALLAGLPAAPTQYSPFGTTPHLAFVRQKEVLRRMREDGYISQRDEEDALQQPIHFISPKIPIRAPHFVLYIKDLLEKQYGPRFIEQGGLRITTSLDIAVQEKAQDILTSHIDELSRLRVGNGAAIVTNPKTGEILAMVGSKDYFDVEHEGNVNVTTSLRPPGSSIKVVTYAAALEQGFTAATMLDDSPVMYQSAGAESYSPVNYDGKFHGPVPLRFALANSYNIPAVKVLDKIGVVSMIAKAKEMGITTWQDDSKFGLSLTLGGGGVTMLDMAKVFGTLANGGNRQNLLPILEIRDYLGHVIEHNKPGNAIAAVRPDVSWILGNILSDNAARSQEFGLNSALTIPGKTVSVKTGTSNDKRDNWTIGYTPSYVVGVWVGNNDNSPMDPVLTSGITGAAPIWHDIMTELTKDKPDEINRMPETITQIPCYFGKTEFFVKGTEPAPGKCNAFPSQVSSH